MQIPVSPLMMHTIISPRFSPPSRPQSPPPPPFSSTKLGGSGNPMSPLRSPPERTLSLLCQKCRKSIVINHPNASTNTPGSFSSGESRQQPTPGSSSSTTAAAAASTSQHPQRAHSIVPAHHQDLPAELQWMATFPDLPKLNIGLEWPSVAKSVLDFTAEASMHDQPLCPDCTASFMKELEVKLKRAEEDLESSTQFLTQLELERARVGHPGYSEQLSNEIQALEQQEAKLAQELADIEEQEATLRSETGCIEGEKQDLDAQVNHHWKGCNEFIVDDSAVYERACSVEQLMRNEVLELSRLNHANALNEAFHIWHDGHFGTINNFRLGRLDTEKVEWNEINAAWGNAALLLHTICSITAVPSNRYRVLPKGSFSVVEEIRKSSYELYGGAQVLWAGRRFDKAMEGFLTCLNDALQWQISAMNITTPVPYPIVDDTVGGVTIKLKGSSDEQWTRALKYMLCDLKWLVWTVALPARSQPIQQPTPLGGSTSTSTHHHHHSASANSSSSHGHGTSAGVPSSLISCPASSVTSTLPGAGTSCSTTRTSPCTSTGSSSARSQCGTAGGGGADGASQTPSQQQQLTRCSNSSCYTFTEETTSWYEDPDRSRSGSRPEAGAAATMPNVLVDNCTPVVDNPNVNNNESSRDRTEGSVDGKMRTTEQAPAV